MYISLPFVDDTLARRVDGVIRSSGLKARAMDHPPCPAGAKRCNTCEAGLSGRCHTKNVVYKISCNLCTEKPAVYIGESKRRVRDKFNEHFRDAKNKTGNTPLGDHVTQMHPSNKITSTSFKISIERVCKDVADLKIAESIEIRNQKPCLNTQTSSWPIFHPPPYTPPQYASSVVWLGWWWRGGGRQHDSLSSLLDILLPWRHKRLLVITCTNIVSSLLNKCILSTFLRIVIFRLSVQQTCILYICINMFHIMACCRLLANYCYGIIFFRLFDIAVRYLGSSVDYVL